MALVRIIEDPKSSCLAMGLEYLLAVCRVILACQGVHATTSTLETSTSTAVQTSTTRTLRVPGNAASIRTSRPGQPWSTAKMCQICRIPGPAMHLSRADAIGNRLTICWCSRLEVVRIWVATHMWLCMRHLLLPRMSLYRQALEAVLGITRPLSAMAPVRGSKQQ